MSVSFITPVALGLLALLPILWTFTLVAPRRVAPWRFWTSLLIRSVLLVALVLALAGAQLVRPARSLTTVFLLDASDSVAPAQRERGLRYINDALGAMPPGDRAAVIVFGENALVEQAPSNLSSLGRINSVPIATQTNLQDAIQLGLALLPADTEKRMVLLSDGGENRGSAAEAARLARVRQVPLDVVPLLGERGADVIVSALAAPSTAHEGQEIPLNVAVRSSFATTGQLQIFVDGQLVSDQGVTLAAGTTDIPVRVPAGDAGFRRLEARLEAQGDTAPQNNRAAAFTEVQGPPRLLLIASDPARASNLKDALIASGVRVDLRTPDQAPADLSQLGTYAGVVIVDTLARAMPRALMEALPIYVHDLGRGLAMVGGTESFGAGGYRRTKIADALPVSLDPLDTSQQPDVALAMVIDRSGSMQESGGGRTKLDLAKEAVYQAALGLSQRDQIGLVVFDSDADWVLPLQKLPSAADIDRALSSFGPGGGTDIRPGIEQAAQALAKAQAKIKHVILLTDGMAESNYGDLIDQMRAAGITISTVAIGADANPNLAQIAERGGGRFYRVLRVEEIPRIFLQETVVVAGRDLIEGAFTPAIALPAPIVRGVGGLPPLYGYNGTEIKQTARAILVTPDGKPVLAQWQYGLGRVIAWTSDFKAQWARDWVGWDQFPRFVGGFADMLLPSRADQRMTLQATTSGAQAALELTAQDDQGRPIDALTIEGRLIDPSNQSAPLSFTQIGAGRYRAVAETTEPGVYLAQVAAATGAQQLGSATAGVVVGYSLEYSDKPDNPQLLRDLAEITGGRADPPAASAFDPTGQAVGSVSEVGLLLLWLALLLWPLDIGLRRLHLRPAEFAPRLRPRSRQQTPAPAPQALARLNLAKRRAIPRTTESPLPVVSGPSQTANDDRQPTTGHMPSPSPNTPAASATEAPAVPTDNGQRTTDDEQFARLLAAKQRARRKRD
jgi:Mg-chelatase subunit ChlD